MIRRGRWLFLVLSVVCLQWLSGYLGIFLGTVPHWGLIFVAALAIDKGPFLGETLGFFLGFCVDVLSVRLFGGNALALTWIGYGIGRLQRQIDVSRPFSQMALLSLVSLVYAILTGFIHGIVDRSFSLTLVWTLLMQGVYNTLLAPVVFYLVARMRVY